MRLQIGLLLLVLVVYASAGKTNARRKHKTSVHRLPHKKPAVHHAPRQTPHRPVHAKTRHTPRRPVHAKAEPKRSPQKKPKNKKRTPKVHSSDSLHGLKIRATRAGQEHKQCSNLALNCKEFVGQCTSELLVKTMGQFCKMTCGQCKASGRDCRDNYSTCKKWKSEGFCDSDYFKKPFKQASCAKSCNLCLDCKKEKFANDCLETTCKNSKYRNTSKCKKYCKKHEGKCPETPGKPEPGSAETETTTTPAAQPTTTSTETSTTTQPATTTTAATTTTIATTTNATTATTQTSNTTTTTTTASP